MLDDPTSGTISILRQRRKLGFLKLAAQYNVAVVPVLSADEAHCYDLYLQQSRCFPFVLMVGRYFLLPKRPLRIEVGEPIDTTDVDHNSRRDLEALADRYYAALLALGKPGLRLQLVDIE